MHSSLGTVENTSVTGNRAINLDGVRLAPFDSSRAPTVSGWVRTDGELRWLAPSTLPPLTADKVRGWRKADGDAYVALNESGTCPMAYGELNPMRHEVGHLWLGHVIVDPALRGSGIGRRFVEHLLSEAFFGRAARMVSLIVFPDNTAAVRCYQSAGFRCAGEEHHRFIAGGPLQRLLRFEIGCTARPTSLKAAPAARVSIGS